MAIAAGLVLGALDQVGQGILQRSWAWLPNSIAVWLAAAFVLGLVVRRPARAAVAAVLLEAAMLAGYYLAAAADGYSSSVSSMVPWAAGAIVGGVLFGSAGASVGDRRLWVKIGAIALLPGALISEGVTRWVSFPGQMASGPIMVGLGLAVAGVLAQRCVRGRTAYLALSGALLVATGLGFAGQWAFEALG